MIVGFLLGIFFLTTCVLYEKYRNEKVRSKHYEELFKKLSERTNVSELEMERGDLLKDFL